MTVLAAASLADALPAVATAWRAAGGAPVRASFDATSRLAAQVEQGVPADVFIAADTAWMNDLAAHGRIDPATRTDLLGNTLVVVVARDGSFAPTTPSALAGPGLRRLALAGENVPAGRYALAALRSTGVWESLAPRVVRADNVRAAMAWVTRGEADAAVVYRTDALADARARVAFAFAPQAHPPVVYPAAVLRGAARPQEAARFLAFCRSAVGRAVFVRAGFTVIAAP